MQIESRSAQNAVGLTRRAVALETSAARYTYFAAASIAYDAEELANINRRARANGFVLSKPDNDSATAILARYNMHPFADNKTGFHALEN